MKTRPRKDIKRLSTAIVRGQKIAKENGIGHATGKLVRLKPSGEIDCCCALGYALLGTQGVEKTKNFSGLSSAGYDLVNEMFNTDRVSHCLDAKENLYAQSIGSAIVTLNDDRRKPVDYIVEALKSCKL